MTRTDELEAQVRAALEERFGGGNGWISLPSPSPLQDLPFILGQLEDRGMLDQVVVNLTPCEDLGGWWEILVSKIDRGYGIRASLGRKCPDDELCARPSRCEMGLPCPDVQELSSKVVEP